MESVVFEGKEYIKASVLAERFRYTQDYLGQLCRGKKVDARLVGRAWYINLVSLEEHRTGRYKTAQKTDEVSEISLKRPKNNYLSRIDVEPVLKNKTVKIFREKNGVLTEMPVRYEKDDHSLIPKVNKAAVSANVPVLPAEAERLKIKKEAKKFNITDFRAEPLPEVYLSGSLKIEGLPEVVEEKKEEVQVDDIANKIKPELVVSPRRIVSIRQPQRRPILPRVDVRPQENILPKAEAPILIRTIKRPVAIKNQDVKPLIRSKEPVAVSAVSIEETKSLQITKNNKKISFSPDIVVAKQSAEVEHKRPLSIGMFLTILLTAVLSAVVILATHAETVADKNSYKNSLMISAKNISQVKALIE